MKKNIKSEVLRYAIALLSFALPVLLAIALRHWQIRFDVTPLLIIALIGNAWYGGRGPGLVVAIGMVLAYNLLAPPLFKPKFQFIDVTRVVLLVPMALFVSGQRKAARETRQQKEWLSVTLSSIGDAVIATDLNGLVSFINPIAESLTGWAASDATNKHLDDIFRIINEETNQTVESPVIKVIQTGAIVGLANHTILISKDGTKRPIDDSGAPIRNPDGEICGVVLVFRDVTERKLAEHSLDDALRNHQSIEERLKVLVEASSTLLGKMEIEAVQSAILTLANRLIAADAYAIWRADSEAKKWRVVASVGLSEGFERTTVLEDDGDLPDLDAPLVFEDVNDELTLAGNHERYRAEGIQSMLVVSLRLHGKVAER